MPSTRATPGLGVDRPPFYRTSGFAALLIAAAGALAYHNTFSVPFVFDDKASILSNTTLRDLWHAGWPPAEGGLTVSGRPILNFTLGVNHALSGTDVWSYHAFNLLIHLSAGAVLFGVIRRTLVQPALVARYGADSFEIALLIAAAWTVHPLQTESVTYVIQRTESLMGLFYLLTLWGFIRAVAPHAGPGWRVVAILSCWLGMATKEVMATAPLLVLLYDRTFVSGTFRAALAARRGFYLALVSSWILLAALVLQTGGNRGGTVGFGTGIAWWAYGATQVEAMIRYVALSFWPQPLVFEYGTFWIHSFGEIAWDAVLLTLGLGATAYAFWRRPALGFVGGVFFLILAPTSLLPGTIQMIVEHRMYLPLAAVLTAAAAGVYAGGGRKAIWALLVVGVPGLLVATEHRNRDYADEEHLWKDTLAKRPGNARAMALLAEYYHHRGQLEPAREWLERSLAVQPDVPEVLSNLGDVWQELGDPQQAVNYFRHAQSIRPNDPTTLNNLGNALILSGHAEEGIGELEAAARITPEAANVRENLAIALAKSGRMAEAAAQYEALLKAHPDDADGHGGYGDVLLALNRPDDAIGQLDAAVRLQPNNADRHNHLGVVLAHNHQMKEALAQFQDALRLNPALTSARQNADRARQMLSNAP